MMRTGQSIFLYSVITPFLLFPFSPLLSFFSSIFILIFWSPILNGYYRVMLSLVGMLSLVYIFASRAYIDELNNDLGFYYNAFLIIKENNIIDVLFSFKHFAGGIEFGIVLLYKLYTYLFKDITPFDLAINNSIICGVFTIVWFEKYGKKNIDQMYWGMVISCILIFISVTTLGYLQRQALATIIILFGLEKKTNKSFIIFTIIASIFHITSLPIAILWRYFLKKKLNIKILIKSIIVLIILRLLFQWGISILINLGFHKAFYYQEIKFAISSYRFLILVFCIVVVNIIFIKDNSVKWKTPVTIMGIFYLFFLGLPLFSERINFIILFLYGYFIFVFLYKKMLNGLFFFILLYLVYFFAEKTNIISMPVDAFWQRYPMFSFEPFYYIQ